MSLGSTETTKNERGISHIKHYCSLFLRTYCLTSVPGKSIHLLCYVHKFTEITRVNKQDNSNFPLTYSKEKDTLFTFFCLDSMKFSICNANTTITAYLCYRSFIYNLRSSLQKSCQHIEMCLLFVPWLLWIPENPQYIFHFNQEMVLFNWVKQVLNSGKDWLLNLRTLQESSILPSRTW